MVSVRARPVVIALVAILAISLAAATLDTAVTHDGAFGAGGDGGFGDGGAGQGQQPGEEGDPSAIGFAGLGGALPVIPLPCFPVLNEWWFFVGFGLVTGGGLYLLYRRKGPLVPMAVVGAFGPPALLVHALLTACRAADDVRLSLPFGNETANESALFALTGGSGGSGAVAGGTPLVSVALFTALGLALICAVALLLHASGDDEPASTVDDPGTDPVQMAAIGRAAGRAADRIEGDADPDNAVYRAWKEMTDLLEVPNPEASTPAEFATTAVEAGMAHRDVDELTSLFETVRYGTATPTEDRERRAVDALRRIEAAYAGDRR